MKKNKFFAGVIVLLFVLSFSVSQVLLANNSTSDSISDNNINCMSGGVGASSCAHSGDVGPLAYSCDVTCAEGFWACCNHRCTCIPA